MRLAGALRRADAASEHDLRERQLTSRRSSGKAVRPQLHRALVAARTGEQVDPGEAPNELDELGVEVVVDNLIGLRARRRGGLGLGGARVG